MGPLVTCNEKFGIRMEIMKQYHGLQFPYVDKSLESLEVMSLNFHYVLGLKPIERDRIIHHKPR